MNKKKSVKKSLSLLLLMLFCSFFAKGQETSEPGNLNSLKFLKNEKFHIPAKTLREAYFNKDKLKKHKDYNFTGKNEAILGDRDGVISNEQLPESEIHAAINPKDSSNIIVSFMRQNPIDFTNPLEIPLYYTKDFGKSWKQSSFVCQPHIDGAFISGGGDPIISYDGSGKAYLTWIYTFLTFDSVYAYMYWAYSEDGGESWKQSDIPFIGGFGSMFDLNSPLLGLSSILDKEWMGTDRSNSAFRGNVYVAMAELKDINTSSPKSTIVLYQKPFDSANFIPIPTKVNQLDYDDMQFASIDVDNSGRIHITFWAVKNNTNYLFHSVSTDGGKSFSKEVLITPFILAGSKNMPGPQDEKITGITSARMYPCPQLAIDKSNNSTSGNIYFTFTAWGLNSRSQSGADIYFTKSIDGGDTWSVPVIVNDDDKKVHSNQFYSSLSVNEDGVIAVSWYDTRNDKNDNVTDYYSTFSFDGGSSFINNFKINSFSTPFSTIGQMNNDFGIGEYNPLLMSKGYLISIWADGRKADGDLDVYSSFIPVSSQTGVERTVPVSSEYKLYEISPNPSENQLTIHFYLDKPGEVIIGFYDLTGKLIQNLKSENVSVGDNHINISLDLLLSGHYYLKLQTLNGFSVNKIFIYK